MKLFVPESGAAFFPILFSKSPTHFRDIFAGVMRQSLGTKILKIPLPQLFLFSQTFVVAPPPKKYRAKTDDKNSPVQQTCCHRRIFFPESLDCQINVGVNSQTLADGAQLLCLFLVQ